MSERLERSTTNRQWAGVCGGLAEYFQVDPTLVRAFFVLATIFTGGIFLLVYIVLIFVMPLPGRGAATPSTGTTSSAGETAPPYAPPTAPDDPQRAERRREAAGWLLVALGVVFLLANVGVLRGIQWNYIWPLALIAVGVFIVLQRSRP